MSTARYTTVNSPIVVNAYLGRSTNPSDAASVHPEIYYTYDGTNLLGDWESQPQTLAGGSNLYQWVVSFPTIQATNAAGVYVVRRFKIDTVNSAPVVTFYGGGTSTASHISFTVPPSQDASLGVRGATNVVTSSGQYGTYDTATRVLTLPAGVVTNTATGVTLTGTLTPTNSLTVTNSLQLGDIAAATWSNKVFAVTTNEFGGGWYSIGNSVTSLLARVNEPLIVTQLVAWADYGTCTAQLFATTYWSNRITGATTPVAIPVSSTGSLVNCSFNIPAGGGLWQISCTSATTTTNLTIQARAVPQ
jgi:hypothetical protein